MHKANIAPINDTNKIRSDNQSGLSKHNEIGIISNGGSVIIMVQENI